MAESFTNSIVRAVGVVTTSTAGSIGVSTNLITGISTTTVSVGDIIQTAHFLGGTKVQALGGNSGEVVADRDSTNVSAATAQNVKFLGITSAYTSAAGKKSILIGGTFANNTQAPVNLTVEVRDSSTGITGALAREIPVPQGSSFVISDAGKTLLEEYDNVNVFCDTAIAIDVNLSILTGDS